MGWCAKPFPGILRSFLCASPFVGYVARSVFSFGRSLVATAKIVHHHAPRQLLGPKLSISEALFTHHAVPFSYSFLTFRSSPLSDLRRGAGCLQRRANHQQSFKRLLREPEGMYTESGNFCEGITEREINCCEGLNERVQEC